MRSPRRCAPWRMTRSSTPAAARCSTTTATPSSMPPSWTGSGPRAGAVAAVRHVKNPIELARLVMEKSPHVLLVGEGAEEFALEQGVVLVPRSYFRAALARCASSRRRRHAGSAARRAPHGKRHGHGRCGRARPRRQPCRRHLHRRTDQQAPRPGRRLARSSARAPTPTTRAARSRAPARASTSSARWSPTTSAR